MADMNEIRDRVFSTIENVADKTKAFAAIAADKAKAMGRIAKLTVEINGEKDTMKKAYIEIGKLYYETHRNDPDGFFIQLCDEITVAMESIASKEAEIAELKASISDFSELSSISSDVDVEFESVVAEEEKCSCGCEDEAPAEEESCSCGCEDAGDESCCCDDGGDAPAEDAPKDE
jgi:hypothetical protein